jgi:hypothetical protein
MEHQLKPPTQPRKVSEADTAKLAAFKTWLLDYGAEYLSKTFLSIYFEYTQLMARSPDQITSEMSGSLYDLQLLIQIFNKNTPA